MLKPQVYQQSNPTRALLRFTKQFIPGNDHSSFHLKPRPKAQKHFKTGFKPRSSKAIASLSQDTKIKVKAIVKVKRNVGGLLTSLGIDQGLNDIQDLLGKTILLELISVELHPSKYSSHSIILFQSYFFLRSNPKKKMHFFILNFILIQKKQIIINIEL